MFKSTIHVTLFSFLGVLINFLTQLLLAYYFGATNDRDLYYAALAIPAYITALFIGSIGILLLPFLVKHKATSADGINQFTTSVLNWSFLVVSCCILLGFVFAKEVMGAFMPNLSTPSLEKGVLLFKIQMASMLFAVLCNLLASVFHAQNSFIVPAASPIITSLVTLLFVGAFANMIGIYSVAFGNLAGMVLSFFFMFLLAFKKFRLSWNASLFHHGLKSLVIAASPLFILGIVFRSSTMFERFFAARLPEGSLSYLGNGNQIILILSTIVSSGIATTSFPLLSKHWYEKNFSLFEKVLTEVITLIALVIFPLIVIYIIAGLDILRILFERGAFTAKDTAALYYTLLALMGYFLFSSIGNIIGKVLYLSHHTKQAAVIGAFELFIYVVCAINLGRTYQFVGLALSMSIGAAFNMILSFVFIRRKVIKLNIKGLLRQIAILLLLSVFVLFTIFLIDRYCLGRLNSLLRVCIIVAIVLGLYSLIVVSFAKEIIYPFILKKT